LLARITAIADAYEVMSTGRAYKKAMSKSVVLILLRGVSGCGSFEEEEVTGEKRRKK